MDGSTRRSSGSVAALCFIAAATAAAQAGAAAPPLPPTPGEWTMPGRTPDLQRYSPLTQITRANVKGMRVAWQFSTGVLRGHEGAPLVVGTVLYVHTPFPNAVYALDLSKPGAPMLWKHVPPQPAEGIPVDCCDLVNRGLAYHPSGKLFIELLAGDLLALDAKTGKVLWRVPNGDYKTGATTTGAPIVIKDLVIAGVSGGEFGVRGRVTAYDVNTGKEVWRAYSTGPDSAVKLAAPANEFYPSMQEKDLGVSTWPGDEWMRGGGTTGGWYSYDPVLNLFYYGTGSPGTWNPDQRPGDNKWSATIFARNPDNGETRWAYQITPHDEWGYDGVNENVLVDIIIGGKPVKALVHFDRNGFAYTLDRTNGKVLVAEPYGQGVNWASKVDLATGVPVRNTQYATSSKKNTAAICPAAIGAKDQQPSAYSPQTGWFYVPTNNVCMDYEGVDVKYSPGQSYVGAIVRMFAGPGGNRGRVIAWDPTVGKVRWEIKENLAAYGGALTTAGGLVFYGTMEGWLKAVDQKSGAVLWQFKTGSGITGNPISFLGPDAKQYVAVLSGIGGWAGIGVAGAIGPDDPTAGLGALGAFSDAATFSNQGGILTVFSL